MINSSSTIGSTFHHNPAPPQCTSTAKTLKKQLLQQNRQQHRQKSHFRMLLLYNILPTIVIIQLLYFILFTTTRLYNNCHDGDGDGNDKHGMFLPAESHPRWKNHPNNKGNKHNYNNYNNYYNATTSRSSTSTTPHDVSRIRLQDFPMNQLPLFSKSFLNMIPKYGTGTTVSTTMQQGDETIIPAEQILSSLSSSSSSLLQPRVFPKWTDPFPCFLVPPNESWWDPQLQQHVPTRIGFLYMKEMKTGSSTCVGVHLRIAQRMAILEQQRQERQIKEQQVKEEPLWQRNQTIPNERRTTSTTTSTKTTPMCLVRFDHTLAVRMQYGKRQTHKSFLWTMLREPTHRAISQLFHFSISREKKEPTDDTLISILEETKQYHHYYLKSLSLNESLVHVVFENINNVSNVTTTTTTTTRRRHQQMERVVSNILNGYNFIGITERMDESLVVLSLLLNLPLTDVLYVKASKQSGGYDDGRYKETCYYIIPSFVSPTMKTYLESPSWKHRVRGDEYLYLLANQSLDLTIHALGKELVTQKLRDYRTLQTMTERECRHNVTWPCRPSGRRIPNAPGCLWQDSGCGNACLDRVANMWEEK